MPSQLNAAPKTLAEQAFGLLGLPMFGKGRNCPGTAASESSVTFTLSVYAQPRAAASAWMIALYRSCSSAKNRVSAGSTTGGAVQSSVVGIPRFAWATSPKPYAKLTSTVSPRGGAQFGATDNGAGANAPLEIAPYHVVPLEKNGSATLLARWPNPTAMMSACAPVAAIESSACL